MNVTELSSGRAFSFMRDDLRELNEELLERKVAAPV
jgi:hypothetical protein